MEKDLRLQAQHRDFQAQLSAEQMAREQVTNTLKLMHQELEALKEAQSGPNPMDVSLSDNADLNHECNKVEQEKHKLTEELEKTKIEYKQALASKSHQNRSQYGNRANKKTHGRTNAQGKSGSY